MGKLKFVRDGFLNSVLLFIIICSLFFLSQKNCLILNFLRFTELQYL